MKRKKIMKKALIKFFSRISIYDFATLVDAMEKVYGVKADYGSKKG